MVDKETKEKIILEHEYELLKAKAEKKYTAGDLKRLQELEKQLGIKKDKK